MQAELKSPREIEIETWAKKVAVQKKKSIELPPSTIDRGIVTCGGSYRYFCNAWVLARLLRSLGCTLEIELWICSQAEWSREAQKLCEEVNVTVRDASTLPLAFDEGMGGTLTGWQLKSVAVAYSRFREVLFLDADNVPVRDPSFLFDEWDYCQNGAAFWPDRGFYSEENEIFQTLGIPFKAGREAESGQMLIDRERNAQALAFAMWMNLNARFFYTMLFGDKDTFPLALRVFGSPYVINSYPLVDIGINGRGVMLGHDFQGGVLFQHRHKYKWCAIAPNPRMPGFQHEVACLRFLEDLAEARSSFASPDFGLPSRQSNLKPGRKLFIREIKERVSYGDGWNGGDKNSHMAGKELPKVVRDVAADKEVLLLSPAMMPADKLRQICKGAALETAERWTEISFNPDGTIGKGATDERLFYQEKDGVLTAIFGASKRRLRCEQTSYGYLADVEGHRGGGVAAIGDLSVLNPSLITRDLPVIEVVSPHDTLLEAVAIARACIQYHLSTGKPVIYRTRWFKWLDALETPGVSFFRALLKLSSNQIDLRTSAAEMILHAESRFSWYCRSLGIDSGNQTLVPPMLRTRLEGYVTGVDLKNYLLVLPEADWPEEPLPVSFWKRFILQKVEEGYEVIVGISDANFDRLSSRLSHINGFFIPIKKPGLLLNLAIGAVAIYGGDNGFSHLCAAVGLKLKTFNAVMPGPFSWDGYRAVTNVISSSPCAGCRRSGSRGYEQGCAGSCFGATQFPLSV